ncbi:MAG: hypothetical protein ACOYOQ_15340 [Microthrixaceae bacterium]
MERTPAHRRQQLIAAATGVGLIGLGGLVTGCGGSDSESTTTAAPTTTESSTTTTAKATSTTAASGGAAKGTLPEPPSGSVEQQTSNANGIVYQRWSNASGETPAQIVSFYQSALEAEGYTVTNTGGGGGGWGKWGGAGAGLTASGSGSFVAVQAGGQTGQPVFFEVCQGSNEQAVDECENQSQGPDSNSQAS